jgi:SulP family sulfate permease
MGCGLPEKHGWRNVIFPFLKWWPQVNRQTLKADLLAGLTGAVVALPQGVAFATIAGMPPEYGLYTGMIPAVIAALFGSSWLLVSGPTTAASVVLYSALSAHAAPGTPEYVQLALTLTMMVGMVQLIMGLARFGALVNFISHSVVVGFTAGAALLIATSQLKHLLGLVLPRTQHFHESIHVLLVNITDLNPATCAVGGVTILAGLLCRRFCPRFPFMISSMLIGSFFALVLGWIGVRKRSTLPRSAPCRPPSPRFQRHASPWIIFKCWHRWPWPPPSLP